MSADHQIILAVNEAGNFDGNYIPKSVGHTGAGHRHLAITVLLSNSKGQVLIQKRRHQIFDNIWDLTGATHPLHLSDGHDESLEEATWRCLKREYGISQKISLKNYGYFDYFADYGDLCENEHCASMVGEYDGPLTLNQEVGYEYKWMDKQQFFEDITNYSDKYTPWAIEMVKVLSSKSFFNN